MSKQILLIGKPDSSKTVFLTQLYSRLQKNQSTLKLYKKVGKLSAISASRESLSNGEEPQPTPLESHVEFELPVLLDGQEVDILCPEYGGEQVNTIIDSRHLNKDWLDAVKKSNNWIVFIRLNSISKPVDIADVTVTEEHIKKETEAEHEPDMYTISEQSSFIELVQILLDIQQFNYHSVNNQTKLTIVLTCWDEMARNGRPSDLLKEKLPLFAEFIEANWDKESVKILGLSALGFSLKLPENKEKYQIYGPEKYGYLILPDGSDTNGITELISQSVW